MKTAEIKIRDPFIVPDAKEKVYYMYGTTDEDTWFGKATGFDMYKSVDLKEWEGPYAVFRPSEDFWASENFWAPEVHLYREKYYMFASFKAPDRCRAVQSLVSDSPYGPFVPCAAEPLTPASWECLDGTLYVEDGKPWLIFCREWLEVQDGEIWRAELDENLSQIIGEPVLMFKASQSGWSMPVTGGVVQKEGENYVTDGPFFCRLSTGELICLWSSYSKTGYAIGQVKSYNGQLTGEWLHKNEPLFGKDGGHGMVFTTFDNVCKLAIHRPNNSPCERLYLINLKENKGWLEVI